MQEYKIGDLVVSTAGRDLGNFYVVTKILDKNYVLLCDGKYKTIEKPKKKKIKHISSLGRNEVDFETKISAKDVDSNAFIKKLIKNFENF